MNHCNRCDYAKDILRKCYDPTLPPSSCQPFYWAVFEFKWLGSEYNVWGTLDGNKITFETFPSSSIASYGYNLIGFFPESLGLPKGDNDWLMTIGKLKTKISFQQPIVNLILLLIPSSVGSIEDKDIYEVQFNKIFEVLWSHKSETRNNIIRMEEGGGTIVRFNQSLQNLECYFPLETIRGGGTKFPSKANIGFLIGKQLKICKYPQPIPPPPPPDEPFLGLDSTGMIPGGGPIPIGGGDSQYPTTFEQEDGQIWEAIGENVPINIKAQWLTKEGKGVGNYITTTEFDLQGFKRETFKAELLISVKDHFKGYMLNGTFYKNETGKKESDIELSKENGHIFYYAKNILKFLWSLSDDTVKPMILVYVKSATAIKNES